MIADATTKRILIAAANGMTAKQIAGELGLADDIQVYNRLYRFRQNVGARSLTHLVALAFHHGLIPINAVKPINRRPLMKEAPQ